jgi:hypothetical protein
LRKKLSYSASGEKKKPIFPEWSNFILDAVPLQTALVFERSTPSRLNARGGLFSFDPVD